MCAQPAKPNIVSGPGNEPTRVTAWKSQRVTDMARAVRMNVGCAGHVGPGACFPPNPPCEYCRARAVRILQDYDDMGHLTREEYERDAMADIEENAIPRIEQG